MENTQASLGFYHDALGMRVAGESENWGIEQEHLNNVFGARLRITALRADHGPGIELLEYLAPRGGRPYPPDARASDLVHWHTRLVASDLALAAETLRGHRASWVSSGTVAVDEPRLGFRAALRVQDPDGHVIEIVQPHRQ